MRCPNHPEGPLVIAPRQGARERWDVDTEWAPLRGVSARDECAARSL